MFTLILAIIVLTAGLIALPESKVLTVHRKVRGLFKKAAEKIE